MSDATKDPTTGSSLPGEYRPISCSLHDRFEAAVVRRIPVTIEWAGAEEPYRGRILDVVVRSGAEYLVLEGDQTVRLDLVESFRDDEATR